MPNITFKPLLMAVSFALLSANVFAHSIETNKTVLQKNDRATVTVKFQPPLSGDLYVATVMDGKLYFVTEQGTKLTTVPTPFQTGTFDGLIKLLDVVALGINPGNYPLYEVVVAKGTDPLNFMNWIGGLGGLKQLHFKIGLSSSANNDKNGDGFLDDDSDHDGLSDSSSSSCDDSVNARKKGDDDDDDDDDDDLNDDHGTDNRVTTTNTNNTNCGSTATNNKTPSQTSTNPPSTVTPVTPVASTASTTSSATDNSVGKKLYVDLTCSGGGCHKADPAQNRNKILKGTSVAAIRQAIRNNPGDMGDLNGSTDAQLQAIADYLKTF